MQRATALCHLFPEPLAEELDGNLWGRSPDRLPDFVGCIGQAVRVDVDADAATGTLHMFTRFQSSDALFKVIAAARTLKFDDVSIDIRHHASFVLPCRAPGLVIPRPGASNSIYRQESVFSAPNAESQINIHPLIVGL